MFGEGELEFSASRT